MVSIEKETFLEELKKKINFDNLCMVCGSDIERKDRKTLKCNHFFHYNCLIKYFQFENQYPHPNQCPYCRSNCGFLELLKGEKPKRNVHEEYYNKSIKQCKGIKKNGEKCNKIPKEDEEYCGYHIPKTCSGIYKTGKNKGKKCQKVVKNKDGLCHYHKKKQSNKSIITFS